MQSGMGWVTTFGGSGTGYDEALDAKEYNGDLYVVGYADMDVTAGVDNDFLIAKINGTTGAVTWQQTYDRGDDDRALKVHVSSTGNIYVVGQTVNTSGNKDITLAMFNNNGVFQWERHYNGAGSGDDIPTGLHVSNDAQDITISGVSLGNGSQDDAIVLRYCVPPIPDAGLDKGICSGGSTTIGTTALPNHTYLWTPSTGLSSATVANPTLTLTNLTDCPVTHEYIVKVTRQGGCFDYDTVNVTVYHDPVVSIAASSPNTICQGQSPIIITPTVNTGCSGTPAYAWKLGTQQVSTSASAYSVGQVNQSGSYTLEVTNSYGGTSCATTSNAVTTTVNPLPVGSASSVTVCSGVPVSIPLISNPAASFAWISTAAGVTGNSASGMGTPIQQTLTGAGTVTYTVTPTATGTGCVGNAFTVTASVAGSLPAPNVSASGPLQICAGTNVILTSDAVGSHQWLLGGSPISGAVSSSYTATLAGNYTVTVTQGGCTSPASTSVQVSVNNAPTVNITGTNSFCTGSSTQLTAIATQGSTLLWSGPGVDGLTTPNVTANLAGNYTVVATNNGCITTSSIFNVTEAAVPTVPTVTANGPLQFCQGDDVLLSVSNASGCINCSYTWQPNGTGTSISASTSNTYTVTATNACGTEVSQPITVTVNPLPVADAGPNPANITLGQSAQLNGSASGGSGGGYQYSWSPSTGLSTPNAASTSASPSQTTTYTLTVTDGNGCIDTDVVTVTVGPIVDCDNSAFSTYQDTMNIDNCGATPAVLGISLWQPQTGCTWEVNAVGGCNWIQNLQPVGPQLSSGSIWFDVDPNFTGTLRTCSLVVTVGSVDYPPIIVNQVGGCGVSIEETDAGEHMLIIAPNPTSGTFDLLLPDLQGHHRFEVFAPMGQLIRSGTIASERTAIDLQGAAAGIYSLRVLDNSGQSIGARRVVVQ